MKKTTTNDDDIHDRRRAVLNNWSRTPRGLEVAQALLRQAHLDAGDHLVEHDLIAAEFDADKHHAQDHGLEQHQHIGHFAASIERRLDDLLDDRSGLRLCICAGVTVHLPFWSGDLAGARTLESHLELHGDAGRANVATKSWPERVEILSAYLGSFGAGGVWPVIVFAAEKPACHAGGRGFEPCLSRSGSAGYAANRQSAART